MNRVSSSRRSGLAHHACGCSFGGSRKHSTYLHDHIRASRPSFTRSKVQVTRPKQPWVTDIERLQAVTRASGMEPTVSSSRNSDNEEEEDDHVIEFRNVWKYFGKKAVLRGVTFKIKRGEAVGIIGPSGTGKSTALRLISGLIAPDRGEILVNGRPITDEQSTSSKSNGTSVGEKKKANPVKLQLGLVFQNGALFDSLTVGENVGFRLYEHSSLNEDEIRARVSENLAKVGLYGIEDRYPSELSGGMKKRVALARAITTELGNEKDKDKDKDGGNTDDASTTISSVSSDDEIEELVMYDEPTAGLDPVASTVVEDLIRSIHNVKSGGVGTYIVVTHQGSTIARAVDRIIFLHEGRVVWQGDQHEFNNTKEAIVRQFASGSLEGPISYI